MTILDFTCKDQTTTLHEMSGFTPFSALGNDELMAAVYSAKPDPLMLELAHRLELAE